MSEWRTFRGMLAAPRGDVAVLFVTFGLTVLVDLTVALGVGMVLASFLFMRTMAETTHITAVTDMFADDDSEGVDAHADAVAAGTVPQGVEIYEIDGPFFFGAADKFKDTIGSIARAPAVLILRMRRVGLLDATGIALIRELQKKNTRNGTQLVLAGVQPQPVAAMRNAGVISAIGEDNITSDITAALERARAIIDARRA
jgi:SulP family sulfate permease